MIQQITEFYRSKQQEYIAFERDSDSAPSQETRSQVNNPGPLTRGEFLYGARVATTDLVKASINSALFLIATLFTAFQNDFCRENLFESASLIPTSLCAIPVGLIGLLSLM